jgi:tRNA dimethylallyltransferase
VDAARERQRRDIERPLNIPSEILRSCWFLAGPTAVGKTAVGIELALRINAEILSLDSMTLYRGMDIGTAKPTPAEQARVPHHLLGILDPHEDCSVAEYVDRANAVCRDILSRGRVPLFVGGTGLYLRALLRGIFEGPPADWDFRRRLEAEGRTAGRDALHRRLQAIDPPTAARLAPADQRRIIRALEVHHLTGVPASQLQQQSPLPEDQRPPHVDWLHPPRAWLHERINRRVEQMFAEGLVAEVRRLADSPQGLSRTASQALGYKEVLEHLAGQHTLAETVDLIQRRTRQFAKRQHTWFRNLIECREVAITGEETAAEIAVFLSERSPSGED